MYAVDLHPAPLAYAAFNAARLGVGARVAAVQGSWFEPLLAAGAPQLAGVVSNPPYIPSAEMPGLQAEVGRQVAGAAVVGSAWGRMQGRGSGFWRSGDPLQELSWRAETCLPEC